MIMLKKVLMKFLDIELAKNIFSITWPMMISELSESIYSITDTFFVSRLGTNALAAVGICSYIMWLFFIIAQLFPIGVIIIVSQSLGAKKLDIASKVVGESILSALMISIPVSIAAIYNAELMLTLLGADPEIISIGVKYLSVRLLSIPLLSITLILNSAFRASGLTKIPMYITLTSVFLNMVLDPLLIFGLFGFPALGVVGAALATVISIALALPLYVIAIFKKRLPFAIKLNFPSNIILKSLKLGLPTIVERLIIVLGNNAYISLIARAGAKALAAHHIGLRVESFVYMPGFAFNIAAASFVGQKVGANDITGAEKVGLEVSKLAALFMTFTGALLVILSPLVPKAFTTDEGVAHLATIYLILAGLSEVGLGLVMSFTGVFRGGGNTVVPIIINSLSIWIFRVLIGFILTPFLGAIGAWLAMFIDMNLRGLIFYIIFKKYFVSKIVRRVV